MSLIRALQFRETGANRPSTFSNVYQSAHAPLLSLFDDQSIACKNTHRSVITAIQLEQVEGRYLLTASLDSKVNIYDTKDITRVDTEILRPPQPKPQPRQPIVSGFNRELDASTSRTPLNYHRENLGITAASWFPCDTGMFVTGSKDGVVRAWDTNEMLPVLSFSPIHNESNECHIRAASMHTDPNAKTHNLVAVAAAADCKVRLADLTSGALTHALQAHEKSIRDVAWCPTHEFILASASDDGTIRLWDIRKPGSLALLATMLPQNKYTSWKFPATTLPKGQPLGRALPWHENQKGFIIKQNQNKYKTLDTSIEKKRKNKSNIILNSSLPSMSKSFDSPDKLQFTLDGAQIVSRSILGSLKVWDTVSGTCILSRFELSENSRLSNQNRRFNRNLFADDVENSNAFVVAPDNLTVYAALDNSLHIYDLTTGKLLVRLGGHFGPIVDLAYNYSQHELISAASYESILFWKYNANPSSRAKMHRKCTDDI